MSILKSMSLVVLCGGLLSGCAQQQEYSDYLRGKEVNGEAPAFNAGVHTVDPNPAWAENTDISVNGTRAADAVKRYRGGSDYAPEDVEISVDN